MKCCTNCLAIVAVGGLAFFAGKVNMFGASDAVAQPDLSERAGELLKKAGIQPENIAEHMNDAEAAMMEEHMRLSTPGEWHRHLDGMVGNWDASVRMWHEPGMPADEATGSVTREWILDGHFVQETVDANTQWGPFKGLGITGYNNLDQHYESVWLESMSTGMAFASGTLDPKTMILRLSATNRDPISKRIVHSRGEMDMSNPNRHLYTEYSTDASGKEYRSFHGVFERKR